MSKCSAIGVCFESDTGPVLHGKCLQCHFAGTPFPLTLIERGFAKWLVVHGCESSPYPEALLFVFAHRLHRGSSRAQ